jgi:hypothetical protein
MSSVHPVEYVVRVPSHEQQLPQLDSPATRSSTGAGERPAPPGHGLRHPPGRAAGQRRPTDTTAAPAAGRRAGGHAPAISSAPASLSRRCRTSRRCRRMTLGMAQALIDHLLEDLVTEAKHAVGVRGLAGVPRVSRVPDSWVTSPSRRSSSTARATTSCPGSPSRSVETSACGCGRPATARTFSTCCKSGCRRSKRSAISRVIEPVAMSGAGGGRPGLQLSCSSFTTVRTTSGCHGAAHRLPRQQEAGYELSPCVGGDHSVSGGDGSDTRALNAVVGGQDGLVVEKRTGEDDAERRRNAAQLLQRRERHRVESMHVVDDDQARSVTAARATRRRSRPWAAPRPRRGPGWSPRSSRAGADPGPLLVRRSGRPRPEAAR